MGKNRGFQAQGTALAPIRQTQQSGGSSIREKIAERQKSSQTWDEFKIDVQKKEEEKPEFQMEMETQQWQFNMLHARNDKRREQELKDMNRLREVRGLAKLKTNSKKVKKKDKKEKKRKRKEKQDKKKKKKKKRSRSSSSSSSSSSSTDTSAFEDDEMLRLAEARKSNTGYRISALLKR